MIKKVTIRRKPISQGRESLYLDYYPPLRDQSTMKMIYKEYLGIYIFSSPVNKIQKEYNEEMLLKAEGIRSIRVQSLINEEYGFLDKRKLQANFLDYFYKMTASKDQKWLRVYKHFEAFCAGKCTFGEVTVDLCRKFREYLLHAKPLKQNTKNTKNISLNSAAGYFSTFRALLKIAHRDKLIKENINDYLDKIEYEDVKKEFLTMQELKKLAATPCDIPVLKRASLFSCLTGLRISDILNLQWDDVEPATEGGYCIRIRTVKTGTETTLPINDEALEMCGKRLQGTVFKGLKRSMIQYPLSKWIYEAGIKKHITFHCFRHTFATLQIAMGTDIFTVSKMLTHKNVTTTQIYAELVSEKKRESANKLSLKE